MISGNNKRDNYGNVILKIYSVHSARLGSQCPADCTSPYQIYAVNYIPVSALP